MKKLIFIVLIFIASLSLSSCLSPSTPCTAPYTNEQIGDFEYKYGSNHYAHYSYLKRYMNEARDKKELDKKIMGFDGYDFLMLIFRDYLKTIDSLAYLFKETHFEGFYNYLKGSNLTYDFSDTGVTRLSIFYTTDYTEIDINEMEFSMVKREEFNFYTYDMEFSYDNKKYVFVIINVPFGVQKYIENLKYNEYNGINAIEHYVRSNMEII